MKDSFINPPTMPVWADCIGQFVINFGGLEFLVFKWMEKLCGRKKALKTLGNPFSGKVKSICESILSSNLSNSEKVRICKLWSQAKCFAKMRNRICHNPICPGKGKVSGEVTLTIVDVNKLDMTGISEFIELNPRKIKMAANRVAQLVQEIGWP